MEATQAAVGFHIMAVTSLRHRAKAVAAGCVLFLAACGAGSNDAAAPGGTPRLTDRQASDAELVQGRDVFVSRCAQCHGFDGEGGFGPRLAGRVEQVYPDPRDQEAVVRDGRSSMPSFGGTLSDAEIAAVVRYEREVL